MAKTGVKAKYNQDDDDAKLKPRRWNCSNSANSSPPSRRWLPSAKAPIKLWPKPPIPWSPTSRLKRNNGRQKRMRWHRSHDPLKRAYDSYQKVSLPFATDPLGKSAGTAASKLATDKGVAAELAARKILRLAHAIHRSGKPGGKAHNLENL